MGSGVSVGVVVIAKSPESGREAAICQIRPLFKEPGAIPADATIPATAIPNSFAKATQPFSHGGLEGAELSLPRDEGFLTGLRRELTEEVGQQAAQVVMDNLVRDESGAPVLVGHSIQNEKEVRTYLSRVNMSLTQLREIIPETPEVYGLRAVPVEKLDILAPLTKADKGTPVPVGSVKMFPDEIQAHHNAVNIIKKPT